MSLAQDEYSEHSMEGRKIMVVIFGVGTYLDATHEVTFSKLVHLLYHHASIKHFLLESHHMDDLVVWRYLY
jgi:hypothetical protein